MEYICKARFHLLNFHIWEICDYAVTCYKYQVVPEVYPGTWKNPGTYLRWVDSGQVGTYLRTPSDVPEYLMPNTAGV